MLGTQKVSSQGFSREPANVPPIPLGSDFDLSFDMTSDFPVTASKVQIEQSQSVRSTFSTTQPVSARVAKPVPNESPFSGSVTPEKFAPEVVTSRAIQNQAPMSMARLSMKQRPQSARTSMSRPTVKAKTYVFGYQEEASYIPKPFISSHRPKTARERPAAVRVESQAKRPFQRPVQLSKKRKIEFESVSPEVFHSVTIGSFEQLAKSYKGP